MGRLDLLLLLAEFCLFKSRLLLLREPFRRGSSFPVTSGVSWIKVDEPRLDLEESRKRPFFCLGCCCESTVAIAFRPLGFRGGLHFNCSGVINDRLKAVTFSSLASGVSSSDSNEVLEPVEPVVRVSTDSAEHSGDRFGGALPSD